jgi:cytochrome oxidase Cu insertion factor (SCO1/SenC/PrrC family)
VKIGLPNDSQSNESQKEKTMRKLSLVFMLCMFVLVAQQTATRLWAQGEKKDAPPEPKFKVGEVAPDFKLLDQNRKEVKLSDYLGKKNVALAFYVFAFTGG